MPEHHDLHDLLRRLTDSWNAGDATAYAALFTDDADYITFMGHHLQGRKAIEDTHRWLFERFPIRLTGSTTSSPGSPARVRLLRPDVAVIVSAGGSSATGDDQPDPERDSIVTLTAVRSGGEWRFASFQNTRQQPLPGRPAEPTAPGSGAGR